MGWREQAAGVGVAAERMRWTLRGLLVLLLLLVVVLEEEIGCRARGGREV